MKKILGLLAIIMSVVFVKNVYAEVYYTNANGVVFDQNQYNYISELYWDGYQNYMTQNDFNMLYNNDIPKIYNINDINNDDAIVEEIVDLPYYVVRYEESK